MIPVSTCLLSGWLLCASCSMTLAMAWRQGSCDLTVLPYAICCAALSCVGKAPRCCATRVLLQSERDDVS